MKLRFIISLLALTLSFSQLSAQRKNKAYLDYIEKYSSLAVKHQKQYGIPASITLAQGLLESGAGRSELARMSNNHFGIKCHSDWKGKRVYYDDDKKDDCFRKYNKPEDSFEDHARFLKRARYASLFELKVTDYRGWAKGLKRCGYATDKSYANKLIQTIELYELYKYDRRSFKPIRAKDLLPVIVANPHPVYRSWGLLYGRGSRRRLARIHSEGIRFLGEKTGEVQRSSQRLSVGGRRHCLSRKEKEESRERL